MELNNIWGYGQLFAFSGLDGACRYQNEFVATLAHEKISFRFEVGEGVTVKIPVIEPTVFKAITGDMIDADTPEGDVSLVFATQDVLIGCAPKLPEINATQSVRSLFWKGTDIWFGSAGIIVMHSQKQENGGYKFVIAHSASNMAFAVADAKKYIQWNIDDLKKVRYAYFESMPACKNGKYEKLYYKAISVNKVNVHTAEGRIPCRWTTPDRVPHKHLWLWDSVFHALAMVNYNQELAKDCIRAVLACAEEDGFIPCMMNPYQNSKETQPQVLSWGVWEVYKKTGDKAFLTETVKALDGYLTWDMQNRDKNGNGLLEWLINPENENSRCGESGLDNSPRFDFDEEMDAVDFSTFAAHDALYLSYIYAEIGDTENARKWRDKYERIKQKMNELLWDEETGAYYDRLFGGKLSKVLTPASFFPLMGGIPSQEQAKKMVKTLTNPELLWTKLPLSTVSQKHPTYSTDMWRGGVWLNLNYFVIRGLKKYGYDEIAEELKNKTLEAVNKWYKKTGVIYEFFDSRDEVYPYECERKGKPTTPPDWRKHVHSISDFNWSACFTLMLIQNELYLD